MRKTMMKKTLIASLLTTVVCASSAYAGSAPAAFFAKAGPYAGGQFGYVHLDGQNHTDSNFGLGGLLGYTWLLKSGLGVGMEAAMNYTGERIKDDSWSSQLMMTGHYYLDPQPMEVFAKFGFNRQTVDTNSHSSQSVSPLPVVDLGVGYYLNKTWEVTAQYEHVFDSYDNAYKVDSAMFGFLYHFS
jgi:opacity protein-like surface antigen